MDDLEKNAEWTEQDSAEESLGYEACQETAEAAVDTTTPQFAEEARGPEEVIKPEEAVESEKTMTDLAAEPELTAAEAPGEEKGPKNSGSNFLAILIGLAAFVGILVFCWQMPGGGVRGQDTGVLYAKDDALYYYDLKNEPYLLEETISSGGAYHYYYTAWGAECAEEGNWIYYAANIDESGAFDLYRKDGQDTGAAAVLISGEVYDYMTSKDGEIAAYLSGEKDSLNLYLFVNGESRLVSEGLHLEEGAYALSGDGKHLAYTDAYSILCAVNTEDAGQPMKLTDAAAMYAIAEEADVLYFVAQNYDVYNIYSYAFDKEEPALVAENVSYMEVMPNGRDLLYCAVSTEEIPYSALITDDMLESDEALAETEGEEYEAKVKRDAIREAMSNGEGIAPVLQDCYIFTNGTAVLAAEDVISAVAVDNQKPFVTGYRAGTVKPIPLSALDGELQTAEYYYYMSLAYGEMNTFLADAAGNCEDLTGYGVQPDTIILSQDARYGAYLASDPVSGGYILMQMEVGKAAEATAVQTDVESFAYPGGGSMLSYYYEYANGSGTLAANGGEAGTTVTGACGVQYAEDERTVYFIQNPDDTTGNGALCAWDGRELVTIAEDVFAFQYKGNGKLAFIGKYDVDTGLGDLYYFDGKAVNLLDTDVTAIFMY